VKRLAVALALASGAAAAAKERTLGVFLPYVLQDGTERLKVGEQLASQLPASGGAAVVSKNFGRLEDFAAAGRELDYVLVESWAISSVPESFEVQAAAELGGPQAWALAAPEKVKLPTLFGKKLAVPRGKRDVAADLLTRLLFLEDLPAKNFTLVAVPNAESAVTAMDSNAVDAVVLPTPRLGKLTPLLKSQTVPLVLLMAARGQALKSAALSQLSTPPFTAFSPMRPNEVAALKQLMVKGPPKRQCVLSDTQSVTLQPESLYEADKLKRPGPPYLELLVLPTESPDP
jgi:hypothetical protein